MSRAPLEERSLVEGLRNEDPAVVREFLERTHDAVYAYACRLTSDPEQRRDWTHDCLLSLLRDLREARFVYRHPGSFWSWFRKRAFFLLLESHRRQRRRQEREIPLESSVETTPRIRADVQNDFEVARAVERCLSDLGNEDHQRALRYLLLDDLAHAEIAGLMCQPLNTVRAWIRRGRLSLRRCLTERLELAP